MLLGPIIPELRATWGVTTAAVAPLFLSQFAASSLGAILSSFDLRRSLVAGYALLALGLAGLAGGSWQLSLPAVAVLGLGLGLVIPASNLFVAHRRDAGRGASLSTLNMVWSAGAVACPLLFAALGGRVPFAGILLLMALAAAVSCVATWRALPAGASGAAAARPPAAGPGEPANLGPLCLLAGMLFFYVGSESAVGGWLVTLADDLSGRRATESLLVGSGFWAAILAGRAIAPWPLRRLDEAAVYRASLTLAAAGTLLLVLAESRAALAAGAVVAGLGMAALFPLTVSMLAAATAATASRGGGWVLACGGLGGGALPWLTGQLAGAEAALGRGFLVPLAGLLVLAALFALRGAFRWPRSVAGELRDPGQP